MGIRRRTIDHGRWDDVVARAGRMCGLLAMTIGILVPVQPARAQQHDIISLYKQERARVIAERILQENRGGAEPHPVVILPVPQVEHLNAMIERTGAAPQGPSFEITGVYVASNLQRGWYEDRLEDVDWTYIGNQQMTRLDTMMTREIRARLQSAFGDPTVKLGDLLRDEVIEAAPPQFEYWFMINGSIPLRIMDVNGPFERGLVTATGRQYRDRHLDIRRSFLQRLLAPGALAPYADYYFEKVTGQWFVTGFDGEQYHLGPSEPPARHIGTPQLETDDPSSL